MATDTERRLRALEVLAAFGGGIATGTASGRQLIGAAARRAAPAVTPMAVSRFVGRHPAVTVLALGVTAQKLGLTPMETAELIAEELAEPALETLPIITPAAVRREKRKLSKANKAVKKAVDLLRAGTKGATGADKGKLPKAYWKMATTAAGLANPKTASKITKGTSKVKRLARTLKKWWK